MASCSVNRRNHGRPTAAGQRPQPAERAAGGSGPPRHVGPELYRRLEFGTVEGAQAEDDIRIVGAVQVSVDPCPAWKFAILTSETIDEKLPFEVAEIEVQQRISSAGKNDAIALVHAI